MKHIKLSCVSVFLLQTLYCNAISADISSKSDFKLQFGAEFLNIRYADSTRSSGYVRYRWPDPYDYKVTRSALTIALIRKLSLRTQIGLNMDRVKVSGSNVTPLYLIPIGVSFNYYTYGLNSRIRPAIFVRSDCVFTNGEEVFRWMRERIYTDSIYVGQVPDKYSISGPSAHGLGVRMGVESDVVISKNIALIIRMSYNKSTGVHNADAWRGIRHLYDGFETHFCAEVSL